MHPRIRRSTTNYVYFRYASELNSLEENKSAPMLDTDTLRQYSGMSPVPDQNKTQQTKSQVELLQAPPTDTRYSVLLASSHSGLPPAFIQVAQLDPLRDEGILYAKLLKEAGVQTQLHA